jgi:hypothetical protein
MKTSSILLLTILLVACENSSKDELPKVEETLFRSDFPEGEPFLDYKDSIERSDELEDVLSLEFTSNEGVIISSSAKVDPSGDVQMIKLHKEFENTIDEELFYYRNGLKLITLKANITFSEDNNYYSETITFYGDTGNVIYSGVRNEIDPDSLETRRFSKIKSTILDDSVPLQLLKQEGPFQTNFLSTAFAEEQEKLFIVVGALDRSFTSTLAIDKKNRLIENILQNQEKYIGAQLKIEFMHTTQTDGFSFQTLLNAELIEK